MKIYTYYTESHRIFFDNYFRPSVVDLEIDSTIGMQDCKSGSYYQEGWKNTTMKKVDVFIKAVMENMGGVFVFSDVDVQFFGPVKDILLDELGESDIAIQNDYNGGLCSGFFICRGNERTLRMFESMKNNHELYLEDQHALNMNLHFCNVKVLSTKFWTYGMYGSQWKGNNFDIPNNIVMHHANWTEGIQNKINLLNIVSFKQNLKKQVMEKNDDYQDFLYDYFKEFRPKATYPIYPPYHEGEYLEGYFFNSFRNRKVVTDRYLIPVDWTTCYNQNVNLPLLQEKILSLDSSKKYFIVSQHDDAVKEYLPKDTLRFCAGGNAGGIPIPLVCSPIPEKYKYDGKKDIFCSFVGSLTHPLRIKMVNQLSKNSKYLLITKIWSSKVEEDDVNNFMEITQRSKFTLCPRGYGRNSFRMYEAMQLGSVPVYIYDDVDWRAFQDIVDWDEFSVSVNESELIHLEEILSNIPEDKIQRMTNKGISMYKSFFDLESTTLRICEKIKK